MATKKCAICGSDSSLELYELKYKRPGKLVSHDFRTMCKTCRDAADKLFKDGILSTKYDHHQAAFGAMKGKIKQHFGIAQKNLFK